MTATITDLDTISHLDWAPGCQAKGCEAAATWFVAWSRACCGKRRAKMTCDQHKAYILNWLKGKPKDAGFYCRYCLTVHWGIKTRSDWITIDRIVPLGGSHDRP